MFKKIICLLLLFLSIKTFADDGYRLWLKYDLIKNQQERESYARLTKFIVANSQLEIVKTASIELQSGLKGLLGKSVPVIASSKSTGGIVFQLSLNKDLNEEGYLITSQNGNIVINANTEKGILYGTFELLRSIQTGKSLTNNSIANKPKNQ